MNISLKALANRCLKIQLFTSDSIQLTRIGITQFLRNNRIAGFCFLITLELRDELINGGHRYHLTALS